LTRRKPFQSALPAPEALLLESAVDGDARQCGEVIAVSIKQHSRTRRHRRLKSELGGNAELARAGVRLQQRIGPLQHVLIAVVEGETDEAAPEFRGQTLVHLIERDHGGTAALESRRSSASKNSGVISKAGSAETHPAARTIGFSRYRCCF
jgi:hypothetical protein